MLKIAIIGCGKIADSHLQQIHRLKGCQVVAACDNELLMAEQLCDRFSIPAKFSDVKLMLDEAKPDVVHITTPPQSHFPIAKYCLEAGSHVYVEKPFTVTMEEAESLVAAARRSQRKLTVGHDDQFRHAAVRMRKMINAGYLGGTPVHMESYYCYQFGNDDYAKAVLSNKDHWVRKLPGKLLHNIISHGIARLAEFFTDDPINILAHGFVSPFLRDQGEEELFDEVRVILSQGKSKTAYFTFSSQIRPSLHQFRIFGPRNGLLLDQDNETLVRLLGKRHKSYLEQLIPPIIYASDYLKSGFQNVRLLAKSDFHPKSGMKTLIGDFYQSITDDSPLPISYEEILRTSRIMDGIFMQLNESKLEASEAGVALLT
ncbi:MAG TPA: Gfo/Idh/MocA family oxidoreductase [Verrucomicrobiae bacterium]